MTTKDGGFVFPQDEPWGLGQRRYGGMTLRDYFAGQAASAAVSSLRDLIMIGQARDIKDPENWKEKA